ncbi:MAG: 2-isopropylmalate synthase [Polyangiaceae bacterium]|nr:2-isopropylmalate synthase [Polyangiaceae bacterium]
MPGSQQKNGEPYDWNRSRGVAKLMHAGVTFQDETLRDGIQNPSVIDPKIEDKLELIALMDRLGIHLVNVGLPAASPRNLQDSVAACQAIVEQRLAIRPVMAARTVVSDIVPIAEIQQRVGIPCVAYAFIGTSEIRKLAESWDIELIVKRSTEAIAFAVKEGVEVAYVTEDTTRARPETLREIWKSALETGARRLCLADTVGHATRDGVRNLVVFTRALIDETGIDGVGLDWHGHNDRGLALDNALWALEYGIDRIHGCALGIGERTGNTPMELLLLNLWLQSELELPDPSALDRYCEVAARACRWTGRRLSSDRGAAEWQALLAGFRAASA